jgi:heat shock protein HspQ
MGMFDYISVADKLPTNAEIDASGINLYSEPFQTKDLDNIMATYFIQGGRLFVEKYKVTEWVDDPEGFAGGYIDRKEPYQEEIPDHHGKIRFYHLIDKDDHNHWVEYEAYFTRGKLEEIKLIEYRKESNVEKKKDLKELFQKMDENRNKWYNKYLFHTKCWDWFRKLFMRFLYSLESGINWLRLNFP